MNKKPQSKYDLLTTTERIAEIERIRDGGIGDDGKRIVGYPIEHRQVEKINKQIEQLKKKW
jgi:hypothetical protein